VCGWNASYNVSFNSKNQQTNHTYDAAGNLTKDSGQPFTYEEGGGRKVMTWIVIVFLTIILLGGLARLLLFFRRESASLPETERSITRQEALTLAIASVASCSFGFFFLFAKILEPLEVLVGVVLVVSLMEVAIRSGASKFKG
jgi:cytochrome b subunit of formate dehydrogenase